MNLAILIGRLGKDPETRYTGGGQAVCNFSLATDESYKDRNGEKQKKTEWHKIVAWGRTAEIAQQYLKKGNQVNITGRIQTRDWQDKEGVKRYTTEIYVTKLELLGGNNNGGSAAPPHGDDDAPYSSSVGTPETPGRPEISDEDIPF